MPQNKIEVGFQLLETSIKLIQPALQLSFIDAYIENGENINDDFQVRVLDGLPTQETKEEIMGVYQQLQDLALTAEEKRKVSQLVLLKGMLTEPLQPNHQLTPDALGFLFVYLTQELVGKKATTLSISDLTVGMGNLLLTVLLNLQAAGYSVSGTGIDIDDSLLAIAATNAQWTETAVELFHQDSLQHLLLDPVDVTIGDLPIGYYPDDQQAEKFVTKAKTGHSYAHHLLMEQSMAYVKAGGFGIFLLPSNFLETEQANELKQLFIEKVYLQGILHLPESLFKEKQSRKSIVILQNHGADSQQAKDVLLAEIPSLKDVQHMQQFFKQFSTWKLTNII